MRAVAKGCSREALWTDRSRDPHKAHHVVGSSVFGGGGCDEATDESEAFCFSAPSVPEGCGGAVFDSLARFIIAKSLVGSESVQTRQNQTKVALDNRLHSSASGRRLECGVASDVAVSERRCGEL